MSAEPEPVKQEPPPQKSRLNPLTVTLFTIIAILAIIGIILSKTVGANIPTLETVIRNLLTVATEFLYLIGGGLVFFAVILVTIRFIQIKLRDVYQPAGVTRVLSGYLTLSLEVFIGAEIVKAAIALKPEDFYLLILVIISRGLFSLILYLERRWHGTAGSE